MDGWWETYVDTTPLVLSSNTEVTLDRRFLHDQWGQIDRWWGAYVEDFSLVEVPKTSVTLDNRFTNDSWDELDPWWDAYIASLHEDLTELQTVFIEVQNAWTTSESRFDEEPLAADWLSSPQVTAPIRTYQEENWSQWLAHLLQSAPPWLSQELFGSEFNQVPTSVEREAYLPDLVGSDRYADILVDYKEQAVSIEVKNGDEHYRKTTHTASLIESQRSKSWYHVLLLPKHKLSAVQFSFSDQLVESGYRPRIRSDESGDIAVLYWQDISSALRRLLQSDIELESHFEASAYLLCTLIEQQIAGFSPRPVVERIASTDDVVNTADSPIFAGRNIADQITYLRETMEIDSQ